jgi:hypothetical protein
MGVGEGGLGNARVHAFNSFRVGEGGGGGREGERERERGGERESLGEGGGGCGGEIPFSAGAFTSEGNRTSDFLSRDYRAAIKREFPLGGRHC